jgi:hypothetical protein
MLSNLCLVFANTRNLSVGLAETRTGARFAAIALGGELEYLVGLAPGPDTENE